MGPKQRAKEHQRRIRLEALEHYGRVCFCCGETNPLFLTLDHGRNDGAQWRRKMTGANNARGPKYQLVLQGANFYHWLKRNNWPQDLGLQVACYNCNLGRARNQGICPHKT